MMAEFHLKFHHSVQKFVFSKHQKKVILAISLLIPRVKVVLKTSVALMTSTDMMTSLASLASTASLASKNQKLLALYTLSYFPALRNLSSIMTSTTSVTSMASTASFHQKLTELNVSIHSGTEMTYPGPSMWDRSSKIYYFIEFWPSFRTEAVEARIVTFNQIQGSTVKCPLPMNIPIPLSWQILGSKTL